MKKRVVTTTTRLSIGLVIAFFVGIITLFTVFTTIDLCRKNSEKNMTIQEEIPDGYEISNIRYFIKDGDSLEDIAKDILWTYPGMRNVSLLRMENIISDQNGSEYYKAGDTIIIPVYIKK